ncbi:MULTISPECIES: GNAT family N-acetyltransferase [Gordonia]|uniref:GNAT family N-acetyltransferase n=1 Tax=Gordonia TaxID=2053 RepID=UPI001EF6927B|nr:GNAT family N-acetyltransferase [Gordonia sp. McavH-238-E]MCG7631007.1 GNAT family N-acetyltransferase [Gordonia sp. McavH-238-E]
MAEVRLRQADGADTDRLVAVWRSAVEATHHFLTPADIDGFASRLARDFFPAVELVVAEVGGVIVGFSGTADNRLEMLFVDSAAHGRGIGTVLLDHAVERVGIDELDVNEQNPGAVEFYRRRGFDQVGRSPVDSDGRPFPLLHLRRRAVP